MAPWADTTFFFGRTCILSRARMRQRQHNNIIMRMLSYCGSPQFYVFALLPASTREEGNIYLQTTKIERYCDRKLDCWVD